MHYCVLLLLLFGIESITQNTDNNTLHHNNNKRKEQNEQINKSGVGDSQQSQKESQPSFHLLKGISKKER